MRNLAPIKKFLAASRSHFLATADRIPDAHWLETPGNDVWSAGEILAHVGMIEESIIMGCHKVSRSAPRPVPTLKKIHLPLALATWRRKKMRSPIPLKRERVYDREPAYAALNETRRATIAFMESLEGQNLSAHRFPHPIFGSLNIYQWYRFIGYHELRHRKQLCELVEIFHP
jgi:DinB superfamily